MKPPLVFLHIYKTAGSTLNRILRRQYAPAQTFSVENPTLDQFKALPVAQREGYRYYHLHATTHFGLAPLFPAQSRYVTMLREPISRTVSAFYYTRNKADERPFYAKVTQNIEVFAASDWQQNFQTRALAGMVDPEEAPADVLARAKRNIEAHFTLVGLTERFDESLLLLQEEFGWPTVNLTYVKVNTARDRRDPLTPADRDLVVAHNQLDLELYQFAQQRFAQQVAQQGPDFARRLSAYQTFNQRYSKLIHFPYLVKDWLKRQG
ncbi:sulfotransferase family 2 domain-containing protein [Candidatus Cyanaurora vandensis]|uniref:sulfotransferase family 2 domain-containing protein n=1 Tax=Candidatus Cyanaurora vandensis TaxID=2714958 RepID=UPI00257E1942|nr:sulfotransferase family 2 domain-containing protein [Candidatus Cyanaurora vandensis]